MLKQIPNIITIIRIISVWPICWLILQGEYRTAFLVMFIAGLSDGLDGFLARHFNWQTPLGAVLDPAADKIMLLSVFFTLGWQGFVPSWLVVLVLIRDVVIVVGAMAYQFFTHQLTMQPLYISKVNTALLITLVLLSMFHLSFYPVPEWLMSTIFWLTVFTTMVSGVMYVVLWSGYARDVLPEKNESREKSS